MKHKSRKFREWQKNKHIAKKERILKSYLPDGLPKEINASEFLKVYDFLDGFGWREKMQFGQIHLFYRPKFKGSLSKGKIHCSCEMCKDHTRKFSEQKKALSMYDGLIEFQEEYNGIISGQNGIVNKLMVEVKNNEKFTNSTQCGTGQKTNAKVDYDDFKTRIIEINNWKEKLLNM